MAKGLCSNCKCVITKENSTDSVFKRRCGFCRSCDLVYQQKYHADNAKERTAAATSYSRKKRFGLSQEEFDAKVKSQEGLCAICSHPLTRPCQDHDHGSGKNRDILCSNCNVIIGLCYEDEKILSNAIKYLQKHKDGSNIQTACVTMASPSGVPLKPQRSGSSDSWRLGT